MLALFVYDFQRGVNSTIETILCIVVGLSDVITSLDRKVQALLRLSLIIICHTPLFLKFDLLSVKVVLMTLHKQTCLVLFSPGHCHVKLLFSILLSFLLDLKGLG